MDVSVDTKSGEVIISLNKKFYNQESIEKCAEEFSGICSTKIECKENFEVALKPKGGIDPGTIGYEFCNYLLASMKNENLV